MECSLRFSNLIINFIKKILQNNFNHLKAFLGRVLFITQRKIFKLIVIGYQFSNFKKTNYYFKIRE